MLVELKARFDEENNIHWARRMEQVGVHVVYGILGLKTHCKMALVVRQEKNTLRRYVHLGTGNYNNVTARIYTDLGLLTCHPDFGADVSEIFNFLTGYSRRCATGSCWLRLSACVRVWSSSFVAKWPTLEAGRPAGIVAKLNSITDTTSSRSSTRRHARRPD